MYIAECAPSHQRGKLVTVNNIFITGGQFIASIVAGIFSYDHENGWRYVFSYFSVSFLLLIPAKAREYVFTGIGLCLRLSVCWFVTTITKKIVVGFAPNFVRRFLREMGRISSCFVTIGRGMWSTVKKLCKPATVYKIALLGNSELAGRRIVSVASVGDTNAFAGICTLSEYFPFSFFVIFVTLKHKIKFLWS